MNELLVVEEIAEWQRLKALVLDSVSSPITRRVYNMALDKFIAWFRMAPHCLQCRLNPTPAITRFLGVTELVWDAATSRSPGLLRLTKVHYEAPSTHRWLGQAIVSMPGRIR